MRKIAVVALAMATMAAAAPGPEQGGTAKALFAGGCFWCMEPPFDKLDGVISTTSGYAGGRTANPTYEQVSSGRTGHLEVLQIEYDPVKVSYEELLDVFWRNIDPLDGGGQFCDKGEQYTSAIFALDDAQASAAQASKEAVVLDGEIQTRILPAATFYPAEEYHQDYYKKNPVRYKYYRWGCGRDQRLKKLWGEPVK